MLFNAKAILLEEHLWYYLTHSWENMGVHIFPKGICPKVNVIARLEYELAYYDSIVLTITPRGHPLSLSPIYLNIRVDRALQKPKEGKF